MAGPDLTLAAEKVTSLMDDTIVIRRDVEDTDDDTLNEATGAMSSPNPDATTVYNGPCMFRPLAQGSDRQLLEGGAARSLTRYRVALPLSAPEIKPGDVGIITASRRDPVAVGLTLRVTEKLEKTFAVNRSFVCEQREPVRDRP